MANWANSVTKEASGEIAKTVGLMSCCGEAVDHQILEKLIASLSHALGGPAESKRLLLIKLDVFRSRDVGRAPDQAASIPVALRSPLGPWSEVTIPMPIGREAAWSLEQLPSWLPIWKRTFDFVVISLGPLNAVPSRVAGRFCDECYVVLGPSMSSSADWIMQHINRHRQCGNTIRGTLIGSCRSAA
jgi:hypothetical protein